MEVRTYFAAIARGMGVEYHTLVGSTEGLSSNFDNITTDLGVLRETLLSMED